MAERLFRSCLTSRRVNGVSLQAEVCFYRMIQAADDYGQALNAAQAFTGEEEPTAAMVLKALKGNNGSNSSTLADFAAGLVNGSNNTISNTNSSTITNILAGLVNNVDLSSLAALLTRSGEMTEETVQQVNKTQELASTADVVGNIFKLMSK